MNPGDVVGRHIGRRAVGACSSEVDAEALGGGRSEQGRANHLARLTTDNRERVEIWIARRLHGRRAVTQLVGARNGLIVLQPLHRPRTIQLCQESRWRPDQGRRVHGLLYECRLAARIALGGGEQVHFRNLHATSARTLGFEDSPAVMFVGPLVWEIKRLGLVAINIIATWENSSPRRDIRYAHDKLPSPGIEVGNRIVIRPFQDDRLGITVRGVVGRLDGHTGYESTAD